MVTSDVLRTIIDTIKAACGEAGMKGQRGGLVRGVHWAELAGRGKDGSWYELKLHHRQDGRLQAVLLDYQPLSRGGRSRVVGEIAYDEATPDTTDDLLNEIAFWIDKINIVRPTQ